MATADALIAGAREIGRFPDDILSSSVLLGFADDVIMDIVVPMIRRARRAYWLTHSDTTIVSGTATYRLPSRAQHATVQSIGIVDPNGNEMPAVAVSQDDAWRFRGLNGSGGSIAYRYVHIGDLVELLPSPTVSGYTLRFRYYRRPSELVLTSAAARVTSGGGTASISVNAVPSTFLTTTPLDYVQASPNFDWLAVDKTPTGVAGPITFATAPSAEGATGDYLALAGQTPIVQVPKEWISVVEHGTAAYALGAVGDRDGFERLTAMAELLVKRKMGLVEKRNEADDPRVVNRDSPLRWNMRAR